MMAHQRPVLLFRCLSLCLLILLLSLSTRGASSDEETRHFLRFQSAGAEVKEKTIVNGPNYDHQPTIEAKEEEEASLASDSAKPKIIHRICSRGCELDEPFWGIPVVFISQGRSGSQSLWAILSSLLSKSIQGVHEDVGYSTHMIKKFMEKNKAMGECWLINTLCKYQSVNYNRFQFRREQSAIYGTKIKPYFPGFNMTAAREAWQWIAAQAPYVKVVYNERNPLDVVISRIKHAQQKTPAHCLVDETKCIQQHMKALSHTHVNVDTLIDELQGVVATNRNARAVLKELQVPYLFVRYEPLFYGGRDGTDSQDVSEWTKLMEFLGRQPRMPLTREAVRNVTAIAATSSPNRSQNVDNYQEVVDALTGTEYEIYLSY